MRHFSVDHLGTPRLVTNSAGNQVAYHAYYPFGEEATAFNQDSERMKFTGHERDLHSLAGVGDDLDYMHARYCSPMLGRFLSVDPTSVQDRFKPQTWNRYAYAVGNPMRFVDPDGADEREGIQAGVVINNSSRTIWIAGDAGGQIVVIPLEPGESSTLYLTDTDAVVVESGSDSTLDGASTGAYKVGAGEVVANDDADKPKNTKLSRSLGYAISYLLGRAGHVDQSTAVREGWVVPAASTPEAEAMKKKLREDKLREERGKRQKEEEEKKERASRIRP